MRAAGHNPPLSCIGVNRLMEGIPVPGMKSVDSLIRIEFRVEICSLIYIQLGHAGKIATIQGKAVVIILEVVAVIFPVNPSLVHCVSPICMAAQTMSGTLAHIVVDPSR